MILNGPPGNTLRQAKFLKDMYKFAKAYAKRGPGSAKVKKLARQWSVKVASGMAPGVADEWAKKFASGEMIVSYDQMPSQAKGAHGAGGSALFGTLSKKTRQGHLIATAGAAQDASFGLARFERNFTMTTSGWMYFIMQEPLSGEKLWVKKLELEPVEVKGTEAYAPAHNLRIVNDPCAGQLEIPAGLKPGENLVFDGRSDAMATTIQQMYPRIMQKFETYLDPAEIESLKQKAQEIREHKVY